MKSETIIVTFAKVATAFAMLILNVGLTRFLPTEVFGQFSLWLNYLNLVALILIFGFNTSHIFHFKKGVDNSRFLISTYLITSCIIFFISILLFYYTGINTFKYLLIISSALALAGLSVINADSQARGDFKKFAIQIVSLQFTLSFVLFIFVAVNEAPNFIALITIYSVCSLFVFIFFTIKNKKINVPKIKLFVMPRDFISYGMKGFLLNLFAQAMYFLDIFLIGYLLTSKDVAYYAVAGLIAKMMWLVIDSVGIVLFPAIINGTRKDKVSKTLYGCKISVLLCLLPAVIYGFCGNYLTVIVFGADYTNSVGSAFILILSSFPLILYKLFSRLAASENEWFLSYLSLFLSVVLNLLLNLIFIPNFGIVGAAWASFISYTFCGVFMIVRLNRKADEY